jgi:carboxypeptidase Q
MRCVPCAARWLGVAVIVLVSAVPCALAQAPVPAQANAAAQQALLLDQKILAAAKNDSQVLKTLTYLSDEIGARLTGSAGLRRANDWTVTKMQEYGLSNAHLEPWTIPAAWERVSATAKIIEPGTGQSLTVAAMAWTPGTKGKVTGDVVFIKAQNSRELTAYKGKLKNSIVLQGPPATVRPITEKGWDMWMGRPPKSAPAVAKPPVEANGKGQAPAAKAAPSIGLTDMLSIYRQMSFRKELSDFLRNEGAAALLMDSGKPQGLLNMTGNWEGNDRATAISAMPALFVVHEHYALLYRLANRPAPAPTRLELEIVNNIVPGPVVCYNTVAEIRGKEKPDEFVVLGAHLDSWDLGQGTTDNGTGSMVVLEAARVLARSGVQPRRTIRFVLFSGEEQGLYGSQAFVKQHKDEMAKTSMCLVHDTGTGRVNTFGLHGRKAAKPILDAELASLRQVGFQETHLGFLPGSDHLRFHMAGVPGFLCDQDMDEYFLTHHSQSDTLDKVKEADLIQGVQVMAVAALRVANLPMLLPRD